MLKQIKSNRLWLGDINYVNTAVAGGAHQEIHKPADNVVPQRWYSVVKGVEVGIFTSWYDSHLFSQATLIFSLGRLPVPMSWVSVTPLTTLSIPKKRRTVHSSIL
jgi:hypothetical protein